MPQRTHVKNQGLYFTPNELSAAPEGSMAVARNVIIREQGLVQSRRGFASFQPVSFAEWRGLERYRQLLFAAATPTTPSPTYVYKGFGTRLLEPGLPFGNFAELPPIFESYTEFFQQSENLYMTSDLGIKKVSGDEDRLYFAGLEAPFWTGFPLTVDRPGKNWLLNNRTVAYRMVMAYKDVFGTVYLSPPSGRQIVTNTSGAARAVGFGAAFTGVWDWPRFYVLPTLPSEPYQLQEFVQIYRSEDVGLNEEPSDEMRLVLEAPVTENADDVVPTLLRGASLYTNASQEGILQENSRPPRARHVAVFQNLAFYADVTVKEPISVSLIDSSLFQVLSGVNGTVVNGSPDVTLSAPLAGLELGMAAFTLSDDTEVYTVTFFAGTTVTLDRPWAGVGFTSPFVFSDYVRCDERYTYPILGTKSFPYEFVKRTSGTFAENVRDTAYNIVHSFNQLYYLNIVLPGTPRGVARYESAVTEAPGRMSFTEVRDMRGPFTFATNRPLAFSPRPTEDDPLRSTEVPRRNRLYVSKSQQPEAVPQTNFIDVGDGGIIQAIVPLQDSVMILKDREVWRVQGTSPDALAVFLVDPTTGCIAPRSAVALNNTAVFLGDKGVMAANASGTRELDTAIRGLVRKRFADAGTLAPWSTLGFGYEQEDLYLLWIPEFDPETSTTFNQRCLCLSTETSAWTEWDLPLEVARIDSEFGVDRLEGASSFAESGRLRRENKDERPSDYVDIGFGSKLITAVAEGATLITFDIDLGNVDVGTLIVQGTTVFALVVELLPPNQVRVVYPHNSNLLQVLPPDFFGGNCQPGQRSIPIEVEYLPLHTDKPGTLKMFQQMTMLFQSSTFAAATLGFKSSFSRTQKTLAINPWRLGIGQVPIRVFVPREASRAAWMSPRFAMEQQGSRLDLQGFAYDYNLMSERFRG